MIESDQTTSAVYLLEGSLDVYSTGRNTPTNITSGQQMTSQAAAPGTPDNPGTPTVPAVLKTRLR